MNDNLLGKFVELTFVAILVALVLVNADEFARVVSALAGAYSQGVSTFTRVRAAG